MTLFCVWLAEDHQPLLVDATDKDHLSTIVEQEAPGVAVKRVEQLAPGVFVAGLFTESDEDDEVVVVDPMDHTVEFLEALDAAVEGDGSATCCSSEGDFDGETVRCELELEHADAHEGTTSGGAVVAWS